MGTLIPWPDLGKMDNPEDFNAWKPVAVVYLPQETKGYSTKLNMEKGLSRIFMRRGLPSTGEPMERPCKHSPGADPWLAKVESLRGASKVYCMHRFEHSLPPGKMPGTVPLAVAQRG